MKAYVEFRMEATQELTDDCTKAHKPRRERPTTFMPHATHAFIVDAESAAVLPGL